MILLHLIVNECLLSHVPLIDCCVHIVCLVDPHYHCFCHLSGPHWCPSRLLLIVAFYWLLNNSCPSFSSFCTTSASSMASLTASMMASLVIWKQDTGSSIYWVWLGMETPPSFWIASDASWSCVCDYLHDNHHHRDRSSHSIIIPCTKDTMQSFSSSIRHPHWLCHRPTGDLMHRGRARRI